MPSYFYHLKFELYPYSSSHESGSATSQKRRQDQPREIWVPPSESDIFDPRWPRHRAVGAGEGGFSDRIEEGRSDRRRKQAKAQNTGGAVIDCGVQRATISAEDGETISVPVANVRKSKLEFPIPKQENTVRDLGIAEKDWRFGRVRVEGLDMNVNMERDRRVKERERSLQQAQGGETSAGGINAGLAAVGKVTKARFESVQSKNTEVGWGIVHLYRDGEETLGLSAPPVEVYTAESKAQDPAGSEGQIDQGSEERGAEDCTTLCIPAVPSYLTPSDFLGFVGEKTRAQVSHFRMVMTGRMNRYLVLMKFRDGNVAKNWKREFDGKVFNSMEVSPALYIYLL